jgi:galactokinase
MKIDTGDIKSRFEQTFGDGGRVHVVRSPGRVNLIGEHTDYNDGFVFPMAIEPHVLFAFRARADGQVRIASTVFPDQIVSFSVNEKIERGEPKWANYLKGAVAELKGAGIPLVGMDVLLDNTLPMGGGLSSSAALEVGTIRSMLKLAGLDMDETRIALLGQKAEHEFALVPCGIMDQTIVTSGKAGHAMLLDCRDNSKQFIPLDGNELRVVIVNSMVKHELSGGEYAERRHQCEQAVAYFKTLDPAVKALRDVTMRQVEDAEGKLDDLTFRRARHVVGETARATQYATLLSKKHYEEAGGLMVASHNSLRDDYNVSTPELDYLVEQSLTVKGVYGARMTGGGFGGCIVALTQPRAVEPLTNHLYDVYPKKTGQTPGIFVTTATAGAEVIE